MFLAQLPKRISPISCVDLGMDKLSIAFAFHHVSNSNHPVKTHQPDDWDHGDWGGHLSWLHSLESECFRQHASTRQGQVYMHSCRTSLLIMANTFFWSPQENYQDYHKHPLINKLDLLLGNKDWRHIINPCLLYHDSNHNWTCLATRIEEKSSIPALSFQPQPQQVKGWQWTACIMVFILSKKVGLHQCIPFDWPLLLSTPHGYFLLDIFHSSTRWHQPMIT